MDIIAMISNVGLAIAKVFGYAQQRDGEKNAPAMQQAAAAKQLQAEEDQVTKDVANGDINAIRKDDSSN